MNFEEKIDIKRRKVMKNHITRDFLLFTDAARRNLDRYVSDWKALSFPSSDSHHSYTSDDLVQKRALLMKSFSVISKLF
jgi:hypothetical protein